MKGPLNMHEVDTPAPLGLIAGSGLQSLPEMSGAEELSVDTPFGRPSAPLLRATIAGTEVVYLRRHGIGHTISPTEINARANIYAMKTLGVRRLLSLSAVGSLVEDAPPGTFVVVDQFIDRTVNRQKTFFEAGIVGHVPFGSPVCSITSGVVAASLEAGGHHHRKSGTYVVMEGPQFSTKAEVELYRSWCAHVIGMTAMPEAKLCREAEICYALVAMVTDYDCWHASHADVTASIVEEVMRSNAAIASDLLRVSLPKIASLRGTCPQCGTALDGAIMTARQHRPPATLARLRPLIARLEA